MPPGLNCSNGSPALLFCFYPHFVIYNARIATVLRMFLGIVALHCMCLCGSRKQRCHNKLQQACLESRNSTSALWRISSQLRLRASKRGTALASALPRDLCLRAESATAAAEDAAASGLCARLVCRACKESIFPKSHTRLRHGACGIQPNMLVTICHADAKPFCVTPVNL